MELPAIQWKYLIPGIAAPILILLWADRLSRKQPNYSPLVPSVKNLRAFLLMIQYAEGTYGPNAYRTLFGGRLFSDYSQHPYIAVSKSGITSTAAGAYQILYRTWETIQTALGLPDFSPASQDKAAIELIRRRGALADVIAGRLTTAINKCRKEWASLPGAGYGQPEHSISTLAAVYHSAGGNTIA